MTAAVHLSNHHTAIECDAVHKQRVVNKHLTRVLDGCKQSSIGDAASLVYIACEQMLYEHTRTI